MTDLSFKSRLKKSTPVSSKTRVIPRPFLKWAGGKGQLANTLLGFLPPVFNNYHEPFLGAGALFFCLYRAGYFKSRKAFLSDINWELITTFQAIQGETAAVISHLRNHRYDRRHYYAVRAQNPAELSPAEIAARMIFLNRTGFNGLYRVNRRGEFNVPFGRYKNPSICDAENLQAVACALQGMEIFQAPFENVLQRAQQGDFVYFDPPYFPLSQTANFVSYSQHGFGLSDQQRLADVFTELSRRGVYVMLSNSDTSWVRQRYRDFRMVQVSASRYINSRADRRSSVSELVVLSY